MEDVGRWGRRQKNNGKNKRDNTYLHTNLPQILHPLAKSWLGIALILWKQGVQPLLRANLCLRTKVVEERKTLD